MAQRVEFCVLCGTWAVTRWSNSFSSKLESDEKSSVTDKDAILLAADDALERASMGIKPSAAVY